MSYWSKPEGLKTRWNSRQAQLSSWIISSELLRQHFDEVAFVTDTPGKELLVDQLGLRFTEVSTALDVMPATASDQFIALGKLRAYALQDKPFVHVDDDLFLWRPLEPRLLNAGAVSQCLEVKELKGVFYAFKSFEKHIPVIPPEYFAARQQPFQAAVNAGLLGGNDLALHRDYAAAALDLACNRQNDRAWDVYPENRYRGMAIIEQYIYFAFCAVRGVKIECALEGLTHADWKRNADRIGFTHLWAGAKQKEHVARRLAYRVRRDYPDFWERLESTCASLPGGLDGWWDDNRLVEMSPGNLHTPRPVDASR
jgi:hypothetical protein